MTDNGSKTRPARTLTVKNFSVIKDATLNFGKITVLIGPQASGKSLLCKLAYFFDQMVPEIVTSLLLLRMSLRSLTEGLLREFADRFPESAWGEGQFSLSYTSGVFSLAVEREGLQGGHARIEFESSFAERYNQWLATHSDEGSAAKYISSLKSGNAVQDAPLQIGGSIYIPTGRTFFSTPNRGFASFAGKNLDWITQRFATEIDWEYSALITSAEHAAKHSIGELSGFGKESARVLGGKIVREDGVLLFQSEIDLRKLPFQLLSSGTLELLPLLNPLGKMAYNAAMNSGIGFEVLPAHPFGIAFIEEPEVGIFPKTQYDLVCLFAWLSNWPELNLSLAITTHSPYTLSSFNNLIFAGQLATERPELKHEIARLVPERYWIENGSLRAYSIHDGVLKSILSESDLIDGEYLDSVSDIIGNEFDSLLRLEYDHTEAS
jgi:hypothetical protein